MAEAEHHRGRRRGPPWLHGLALGNLVHGFLWTSLTRPRRRRGVRGVAPAPRRPRRHVGRAEEHVDEPNAEASRSHGQERHRAQRASVAAVVMVPDCPPPRGTESRKGGRSEEDDNETRDSAGAVEAPRECSAVVAHWRRKRKGRIAEAKREKNSLWWCRTAHLVRDRPRSRRVFRWLHREQVHPHKTRHRSVIEPSPTWQLPASRRAEASNP